MNPLPRINKLSYPFLTLALVLSGLSSAVAQTGTNTWVTNRSGDYLEATNWAGGVAPGISSNVVFNNPDLLTTSTVTFSASATNGQAWFQRGVFVMQTGANSWTLTNATPLQIGTVNTTGFVADVTFDGGTVNVSTGQVVVGVQANNSNSVLRLTNGAILDSQGSSALLVGRAGSSNQLVVAGGSIASAAGLQAGSQTGSSNNLTTVHGAGSELRLRGSLTLNVGQGTSNNALVISNGGTVYVTNATAGSARIFLGNSVGTTNDGASILITGSGSRLITTADQIQFNTTNVVAGATGNRMTVANGGLLQATNASLQMATPLVSSNRFIMDGGTANLRRTTLQNASMDVLSGQLNFSEDFTTALTWTLNFAGGTISAGSANFNTGALTVGDGSGVAAGYVLTGNGTHGIGSVLTVRSDGSVSGNGVIASNAAGTTATAVLNSGTISAGAGQTLRVVGSLTNQIGSTLSVSNGGAFIASAASTNAGTVNIGSGSSATFSNGLSSAGAINVNGTLTGATTVASGGMLSGSGTMASVVTISGTLAPGNSIGTLTVANDVTWNGGNNWVFELGAAGLSIGSPGSSDRLSITGAGSDFIKGTGSVWTFDFAGTGNFGWYKLVEWAGTTTFATNDFLGANLGGGYTSEFAIQDSALYVNVVPEPSTYALLALAGAGLAGHVIRRRRL